jgi:hypothetical protein
MTSSLDTIDESTMSKYKKYNTHLKNGDSTLNDMELKILTYYAPKEDIYHTLT